MLLTNLENFNESIAEFSKSIELQKNNSFFKNKFKE
jgi:hypothetical protein